MERKLWNRDFILLLQGCAVSMIGDILYSVAIGYWVYEKTGSNTLLGLLSSVSSFMAMFLSPFTGSITDKLNRKHVICRYGSDPRSCYECRWNTCLAR